MVAGSKARLGVFPLRDWIREVAASPPVQRPSTERVVTVLPSVKANMTD